mmetsp:Transcript_46366/g.116775  ORF Transcript_46366/g.116775 Transcript_46366/m.116775 type:complete len:359 (+) Transcript_46366:538-1614(+)
MRLLLWRDAFPLGLVCVVLRCARRFDLLALFKRGVPRIHPQQIPPHNHTCRFLHAPKKNAAFQLIGGLQPAVLVKVIDPLALRKRRHALHAVQRQEHIRWVGRCGAGRCVGRLWPFSLLFSNDLKSTKIGLDRLNYRSPGRDHAPANTGVVQRCLLQSLGGDVFLCCGRPLHHVLKAVQGGACKSVPEVPGGVGVALVRLKLVGNKATHLEVARLGDVGHAHDAGVVGGPCKAHKIAEDFQEVKQAGAVKEEGGQGHAATHDDDQVLHSAGEVQRPLVEAQRVDVVQRGPDAVLVVVAAALPAGLGFPLLHRRGQRLQHAVRKPCDLGCGVVIFGNNRQVSRYAVVRVGTHRDNNIVG